ncbi:MAG TPA: DUF1499 domain-containing protein [Candidatus Competibacteraceae bacterium]|nr:DUF1499 domain-containing protein [Candidatus Competibacteraceae bacterium]
MLTLLVNTVTLFIAALGCLLMGALVINNPPLGDPPGMWVRLRTYLTQNVAETRRDHEFHELELRCYRLPPKALFTRVEHAIHLLDWEVVEIDPRQHTLHAVITTPLFRFKDDLYVRLQVAACGTELHIRSQSRVGRGDLAANTRHILDLLEVLSRQL